VNKESQTKLDEVMAAIRDPVRKLKGEDDSNDPCGARPAIEDSFDLPPNDTIPHGGPPEPEPRAQCSRRIASPRSSPSSCRPDHAPATSRDTVATILRRMAPAIMHGGQYDSILTVAEPARRRQCDWCAKSTQGLRTTRTTILGLRFVRRNLSWAYDDSSSYALLGRFLPRLRPLSSGPFFES
jgi:hypothetical protein